MEIIIGILMWLSIFMFGLHFGIAMHAVKLQKQGKISLEEREEMCTFKYICNLIKESFS